MMNRKLLALFGIKWNPFATDIPSESLYKTPAVEHFCWRVENALIREGGFGLISGEPGTGKSVCLRILCDKLSQIPELSVAVLTHPSSNLGDFYRELGELFGVELRPTNRWGGFKNLRDRWVAHQKSTLLRPVLLIDEAQEMIPCVMNELRLLSSMQFDSQTLLTVVFSGDNRLLHKLQQPELLPLNSRVRVRLNVAPAGRQELLSCLDFLLEKAGNKQMISKALAETLVEHCVGNYRVLMTLANELLLEGIRREVPQLDEKLYLEVYGCTSSKVG